MSKEREAMKLALEALEELWGLGFRTIASKQQDAITALRERLAQPGQEPVAWADMDVCGEDKGLSWTPGHFHKTPLYTAPPQRTWIGLTDDEISQGCKESCVTDRAFQLAVWWAAAKLKEKNT